MNGMARGDGFRGAHASRVLVSASRRNELPGGWQSADVRALNESRTTKVRRVGTTRPTRGTRVLPGIFRRAASDFPTP